MRRLGLALALVLAFATAVGAQEVGGRSISPFSFDGTNVTLTSGQLLYPSGALATPSLAFSAEPALGFYRYQAGNARLTGNLAIAGPAEVPASLGHIALPATAKINIRNNANGANLVFLRNNVNDVDDILLGSASSRLSLFSDLGTPTNPAQGQAWDECVGNSPARVCAHKIYDGGAVRTIGSVTY